MPIETLLNYLIETKQPVTLSSSLYHVPNVTIQEFFYKSIPQIRTSYPTNNNYDKRFLNILQLPTTHLIADLDNFHHIGFDAIITKATTPKEMEKCIKELEDTRYNAYLYNSKDEMILCIFHIND